MTNTDSGAVSCPWLESAAAGEEPVFFSVNNKTFILRRMKAADYPAVRALLPQVSRCYQQLQEPQLSQVLGLHTYIPFCCFAAAPDSPPPPPAAAAGAAAAAAGAAGAGAAGVTNGCAAKQPACEGPLCGFAEVYVLPHLGRAADGRLERVIVAAELRGQGLGTAMCREVLRFSRLQLGLGRVDLTVEKENAKHIYTKLGFEPVSTETLRLQN
ncbi:acetyltransferase domain-containing protein, putative [Eimeria mitis]|uniref:Acetyltransferase domain-containing protein, putative n=1 Tax=Eimeria mitis TaxID=44415 RepID=U6JWF0_9EIME|nr:acetyltransferase domain-containing protein, putative [Eimeria mitis]CDJ29106.1 acetyltransferase domain-containing protein, putative [Eimeria mitis]